MKYDSKNLRIYSIVLIVFSICDIIAGAIGLITEGYNVKEIAKDANVSENLALIALIVVFSITFIIALAYFYLGIKGIHQANGKCKGGLNITIAKIFFVVDALCLISDVICIIRGNADFRFLTKNLINMCMLYPYIKCAKN